MSKLPTYVCYNEITEEIIEVDWHAFQKFGYWFYPAHNIIFIGEI